MTRIVVDDSLLSKLQNLVEPLELCDKSGRVLARVVPSLDPAVFDGLQPKISREELERRKLEKDKTYSTAEVLEHLEKL